MRGRLRNVDVASCDPAFLGQNSETEQGPECSGAGHNSEANWQCVSGILGIMGLLLLFHMTQLWNTWHYGVFAAVSHDPAFVGQVTAVWRNCKCVWNTWSYRYVIAASHDPDFLEQVPAFGEKGSVAPDIMRMLLLLHMTQLFSDRSLRLGAWWGVSGIPSVPGALQLVRPVSAGREGGSGAGQVHSPPSLPALHHGQGMGQVSASRLWRGAGGFFVHDHTFCKGNRSFDHRHMCKWHFSIPWASAILDCLFTF